MQPATVATKIVDGHLSLGASVLLHHLAHSIYGVSEYNQILLSLMPAACGKCTLMRLGWVAGLFISDKLVHLRPGTFEPSAQPEDSCHVDIEVDVKAGSLLGVIPIQERCKRFHNSCHATAYIDRTGMLSSSRFSICVCLFNQQVGAVLSRRQLLAGCHLEDVYAIGGSALGAVQMNVGTPY